MRVSDTIMAVVLFLTCAFALIINGYHAGRFSATKEMQKQAIKVGVAQHNPVTGCFEWVPPQKD